MPWCYQAEARRTLPDIINADLGFTGRMMDFALDRWLADRTLFDKRHIDTLKNLADAARDEALRTCDARIASAVAAMSVIHPSADVVERTIRVFAVKPLKPFDEMVLGAVLRPGGGCRRGESLRGRISVDASGWVATDASSCREAEKHLAPRRRARALRVVALREQALNVSSG